MKYLSIIFLTTFSLIFTILCCNFADDFIGVNQKFLSDEKNDDSSSSSSTSPGPTVNITSTTGSPTNTNPIPVTITFSEQVTGFTIGDITVGNGSPGNFNNSGNIVFTADITPTTDGFVTVFISAGICTDLTLTYTNNSSNLLSRNYDSTSPEVTINQAGGQSELTGTPPINFTVVFSESVSNFATGDITITGTSGGTKTATVTGSGTTYNVAVTGMTTGGTVIASIASGVAVDGAGNLNNASTSTDNTVTWYTVEFLSPWYNSGGTATITGMPKPGSGTNRILLIFVTARKSTATASTVTSIAWGGQTLNVAGNNRISERTYDAAANNVTNSVWYLKEAGITSATSPSNLVVTWAAAPTYQQVWAVFLQNVNQTTSFASVQGGNSLTTNVFASAAVSNGIGDIGFLSATSITTVDGSYTINTAGFTLDNDNNLSGTFFDALVAHQTFYTSGTYTPDVTRATSTKQTIQGFVIKVN